MFKYSVSGLSVVSDMALPGLIEREAPADMPDVTIVGGDVPEGLEGMTDSGPNWQVAGDHFLFTVPGIVRMLLLGGHTLRYAPIAGVSDADLVIFLSATGLGILLQQRGRMVLHASAVRVGDSAMLFCGPSGAGKSTLAAALGEAGYDMLSDDICSIELRGDRGWVAPDGRRHKLWQNAISQFALDDRRADPVRVSLEKFFVEPRAHASEATPIGAIYHLREDRPPYVAGIDRPNLVDASLILRRNAYRPALVRGMGQRGLYFHGSATLAQHTGIYHLTRPLRFAAMPATIASLEAQWGELGLLDPAA